jgi:hypothetical protein
VSSGPSFGIVGSQTSEMRRFVSFHLSQTSERDENHNDSRKRQSFDLTLNLPLPPSSISVKRATGILPVLHVV